MKNKELWKPNKYIFKNGKLRATGNTKEVNIFSWLMTNIIAEFYDEQIKIHVKGRLIDLGCGKVPLYEAYKNFVTENICVDWGNTNNKNVFLDYELDLNKKLPFNEHEFDTIILSDVLEHIRKPELLLDEIFRILNIKGKLLMNVPFCYGLHEQPFDFFRYTKHALKSMAEDSGFTIIMLEPLGGTPEVLADMLSKNISVVPLIGKPFAFIIQKLTWWFIKRKLGKKISNKTAAYFPLGYKMIVEKTTD